MPNKSDPNKIKVQTWLSKADKAALEKVAKEKGILATPCACRRCGLTAPKREPRATLCNVLNRLAYRHSFESTGLAQALHGESRAGIVLAVWRNVIVANDVIELVPGNERFGHFQAHLKLRCWVGLPFLQRPAVLVLGFDRGLRPLLEEGVIVASVRQLDTDRAGIEPGVTAPSALPRMAARAIEGAALDHGTVSINDKVSARTFGLGSAPEINGTLPAGSAGEVNHEEAADAHRATARQLVAFGGVQPMLRGDVHVSESRTDSWTTKPRSTDSP